MRFASDARLAFGLLALSVLALAAFVVVGFGGPLPSRALRSPASEPAMRPPVAGTEFVDVTDQVGLAPFQHDHGQGVRSIVDAVAPGLGLLDLDEDGDLDLVLLGGPASRTGVTILLNRRAERQQLRFEDVTDAAGITWRGAAQGVCAGDVDGDGDVDLFITVYGDNLLLLNQLADRGTLAFVEAAQDAGVRGGRWHWIRSDPLHPPEARPGPPPAELGPEHEVVEFSTGATFGDLDADGDLDLYVANYLSYFEERHAMQMLRPTERERLERSEPFRFQPQTFESQPDRLYLNDGDEDDLLFREITRAARARDPHGRGLGVLFMLIDADLYPELYVANDASDNVLFRNVPADPAEGLDLRRRFDDATAEFGLHDPNSGMGIARGDADGDADLDLLTTNWRFQSASLFLFRHEARADANGAIRSEPTFEERSDRSGLGRATSPFVGWGCVFFDYDNDGDQDVFIGNGFTSPREGALACTPEKPLLFQNDGAGHFVDVTASAGPALGRAYAARGVVAGDLDQDGDLDLVIAQNDGPVVVLENRLPDLGNRSLTLAVSLRPMRADAVNVLVTADVGERRLVQELLSGGSYLCQGPFEAHFGLGRLPRADRVRITWPFSSAPAPRYLHQVAAGRHREILGER